VPLYLGLALDLFFLGLLGSIYRESISPLLALRVFVMVVAISPFIARSRQSASS
jgi:hypothetical protein